MSPVNLASSAAQCTQPSTTIESDAQRHPSERKRSGERHKVHVLTLYHKLPGKKRITTRPVLKVEEREKGTSVIVRVFKSGD